MSKQEETIVEEEEEEKEQLPVLEAEKSEKEPTAVAAADAATSQTDEMKIVITMKGNRAMIGVQAPDCDPVFETAEGDLSEILAHSHIVVDNARAKWATSKRNPKADLPKPVTPPAPARTATTPASKKPAAAKAATTQPKFF